MSSLVASVEYKTGANTRLTTWRWYDGLNRLTQTTSAPPGQMPMSYVYGYNVANLRVAVTNTGGVRWEYQYDYLGQLTNAVRRWSDGSLVAGQQFGFYFDGIGNRKWARQDGRTSYYAVNNLFQYIARTVPGYVNILGSANSAATVTVNDTATSRKGEYYRAELAVANTAAARWLGVTNLAVMQQGSNPDIVVTNVGWLFVPKTPEVYTYDADGNLTSDGQWTNRWDAENRLVEQETLPAAYNAGALQLELRFWYDWEPCPPTSLGNIIPSQLEGVAALHCITKKFRKNGVSFRSGQNQRPSLTSITMRKIFILMEIGRRVRMDSIPFTRSNLFF